MPKVATLNAEDLARWRFASADKELAGLSFPGLSVDEARRAILQYYKILGDLLVEYKIDPEDTVIVSPVDGNIYRVDIGNPLF